MAMARAVTRRARSHIASVSSPAPVHRPREDARVAAVDALRGIALLMMFVYHLAFDLRYYRVIAADFEHDPFWLSFRALILASFMTLVGISLVLADTRGIPGDRFLRRVGLIALGAAAATLASWLLFPASFIYFGVLHCIAVTSLLAWPMRRAPMLALIIGTTVLVAGLAFTSSFFDAKQWSWIGFMTRKPFTEDYVPLAPWAGTAFLGIALGHALVRDRFRAISRLDAAPRWLQWMGRHSLAIYLVHQPVFMGALWLVLGR